MPTPIHKPQKLKRGPSPTCLCGKCPVCKNRKRQKKFYDKNIVKLRAGKDFIEEEEDDFEEDE